MRDWKGDPPNLYDISGSAHFINKCDNGIVVHRNNDPAKGPASEVNSVEAFPTLSAEAQKYEQEHSIDAAAACQQARDGCIMGLKVCPTRPLQLSAR